MKKKYGTLGAFAVSAILIVIGLMLGQNSSMLNKAAQICLECIGIG